MYYAHISATEREVIAFRHIAGDSLNQIASLLGRSQTTISSEIRRNRTATLNDPHEADKKPMNVAISNVSTMHHTSRRY